MPTDKNPPLGEIICPIGGEVGTVHKARGKRKTLYLRCPCCGTQQGNGAAFQALLEKYVPIGTAQRPQAENVSVSEPIGKPEGGEIVDTVEAVEAAENLGIDDISEPKEAEPEKPNKGGLVLLVAAGGLLAAMFGLGGA